LEQSAEATSDPEVVAELKRILLRRIADLEMIDALGAQSSTSGTPDEQPGDLPPLEIVAAEAQPEAAPVCVDEGSDVKP
jgi:hypothetical protein